MSVLKYLVIYIMIFIVLFMIVSLDMDDFETAFAAVSTTFNNVGPGLGAFGPITTFCRNDKFIKICSNHSHAFGKIRNIPNAFTFVSINL